MQVMNELDGGSKNERYSSLGANVTSNATSNRYSTMAKTLV
jgi:hypothetical protein